MSIMASGMRGMMELLDKLSVPQIQQGMKAGRYPAYLAIPAIELKTRMQKQFEQQRLLQQPSPKETPTVAERVMQEAQGMGSSMGAEIGAGVSGLPSNLPQEYAEGGVVALADGGEVERYAFGGDIEGTMDAPAADMGSAGVDEYKKYARQVAAQYGVDPDLVLRMMNVESAYNPNAVSPKGAMGLMQLMPGTAKGLGIKESEIKDPYKNIEGGVRYLKEQLDRFGDPEKAVVAYNMGPTALTKHLQQYGGVNPEALPKETQGYRAKLGFSGGFPQPLAAALTSAVPVASATAAAAETQPTSSGPTEPAKENIFVKTPEEKTSPAGRWFRETFRGVGGEQDRQELIQKVANIVGPRASPILGAFMEQSDDERAAAQKINAALRNAPTAELQAILQKLNKDDFIGAASVVGQGRMPDQVERLVAMGKTDAATPTPPSVPKETQVAATATTQPSDVAPAAIDIMSMVQDAPAQIKAALGEMRDKRKAELDKMDEPSIALLEKRYAERGKKLESRKEEAAMNAALSFLSGVAGTRGHWATALAAGGKDMLNSLVTSQAAQQAAQDKFDEAADNLELRKLALKKDNAKAADAYGEKYASLIMQGTKLQVEGAYHFNKNQIDSFDADTKRQALIAGRKKLEIALAQAQAGNLKARASVMAMGNRLLQAWETTSEKRDAEISITEKYGPDWRKLPLKSEKRLQADAELQQAKTAWVENSMALQAAMGVFDGGGSSNVKDYYDLI